MREKEIHPTKRTQLKQRRNRGSFDRETIYSILDEGFVCHVGFTIDAQPFVIPTAYARMDDQILIHGSHASRMMRALAWEIEVCVTVTLIDGIVLARSAFHHSMNYRSVCIFGRAQIVQNESEKLDALRAITEHIVPNRWSDTRLPNEKELKATMVLSLPIEEASAKIRAGAPVDDETDYDLDFWAGVIPVNFATGQPIADSRLPKEIDVPDYVTNYRRTSKK